VLEDDRGRIYDGDYTELSPPHEPTRQVDHFWTDGCSFARRSKSFREIRVNKVAPPVFWMIVERREFKNERPGNRDPVARS
jgi:hypothetical protein